jgi:hypothetical protein
MVEKISRALARAVHWSGDIPEHWRAGALSGALTQTKSSGASYLSRSRRFIPS